MVLLDKRQYTVTAPVDWLVNVNCVENCLGKIKSIMQTIVISTESIYQLSLKQSNVLTVEKNLKLIQRITKPVDVKNIKKNI